MISTVGVGLCFLGTATYAHFLDSIPGVAVTNIVANVSAVEVKHDGDHFNITTLPEFPDWMMMNSTEEFNRTFGNETQRIFKRDANITYLVMVDPVEELMDNTTKLASNEATVILLNPILNNQTRSQSNETIKSPLPKLSQNILLKIPNVEQNRFLWLPLTLLLFSAMFAHMGIKLIPWMLIGEV